MKVSFCFLYFHVMQSCFIQIKYCSNILIIPFICWFFGASAVLLAAPLHFYDPQTNVVLFPRCSVAVVNPDAHVAPLNGFIYKFLIHYSSNQKRPSRCKQSGLPQVSGFQDSNKRMVSWFSLCWCRPVGMFLLISRPLHWRLQSLLRNQT